VHKKNIIGLKIKEARINTGISQLSLAAKLQVLGLKIDRSAIAKIETDRRPINDIEIAAIAEILNVSISWLFECSED
jgi:transcriptional regulator with XRE-family HTH domain